MSVRPVTAAMVEEWLRRRYTQQADARQKAMGLDYTTVETKDLARMLAKSVNEWFREEMHSELQWFTDDADLDALTSDL